jgi:hypothetical protein
LARAEVRVYELQTQPGGRPWRGPRPPDLFAFTGADGRFALQGVVEGPFVLQASHSRAPATAKVPSSVAARTAPAPDPDRRDRGALPLRRGQEDGTSRCRPSARNGRIAPGRTSMGNGLARLEV